MSTKQGQQDTSSSRTLSGPSGQGRAVVNVHSAADQPESQEPQRKRRREDHNQFISPEAFPPGSPRQNLMPPPPRPSHPGFQQENNNSMLQKRSQNAKDSIGQEGARIQSGAALLDGDLRLFPDIPESSATQHGESRCAVTHEVRPSQGFASASNRMQRACLRDAGTCHASRISVDPRDSPEVSRPSMHHSPQSWTLPEGQNHTPNWPQHESHRDFGPDEQRRAGLYTSQLQVLPYRRDENAWQASGQDRDDFDDLQTRRRLPPNRPRDSNTAAWAVPSFQSHSREWGCSEDRHQQMSSPQKSSQAPRQVHTPSPQKSNSMAFESTQSISSPFYNPKSAQQHIGRMTLPDRSSSDTKAFDASSMPPPPLPLRHTQRQYATQSAGKTTPRFPPSVSSAPSSHYEMQTPPGSLVASRTPRNAEGLFQRPDDMRPTSRYFSGQGHGYDAHDSRLIRPSHFSSGHIPQIMPPMPSVASGLGRPDDPRRRFPGVRNFQYQDNMAGSRSGKSRPSKELARGLSDLNVSGMIGGDSRDLVGGLRSSQGSRRPARR